MSVYGPGVLSIGGWGGVWGLFVSVLCFGGVERVIRRRRRAVQLLRMGCRSVEQRLLLAALVGLGRGRQAEFGQEAESGLGHVVWLPRGECGRSLALAAAAGGEVESTALSSSCLLPLFIIFSPPSSSPAGRGRQRDDRHGTPRQGAASSTFSCATHLRSDGLANSSPHRIATTTRRPRTRIRCTRSWLADCFVSDCLTHYSSLSSVETCHSCLMMEQPAVPSVHSHTAMARLSPYIDLVWLQHGPWPCKSSKKLGRRNTSLKYGNGVFTGESRLPSLFQG